MLQELKQKKLIVIGTIFMDIKGYPEGTFLPEGRNIGHIEYKYGGVGRNVAANLAAFGCHPLFVSLSEPEGHGAQIVADLEKAGVNTAYMQMDPEGIGTWMAIFYPDGSVCANISKRQDLTPLCRLLQEKEEELFREADGILLEMDVAEEVVSRVFSYADAWHLDVYGVISNMTVAMERMEFIRRCRCFICNRQEAEMLFGKPVCQAEELQEMIRRFRIPCMVVTMDKDGAVFADQNGEKGQCSAVPVSVVDSTGAGDAFFSAAAASLVCGTSLEDACCLGSNVAAQVLCSTENVYQKKPET